RRVEEHGSRAGPWATRSAGRSCRARSDRPAPPSALQGAADPGNIAARERESLGNARLPGRPRVAARTTPSGFAFAVESVIRENLAGGRASRYGSKRSPGFPIRPMGNRRERMLRGRLRAASGFRDQPRGRFGPVCLPWFHGPPEIAQASRNGPCSTLRGPHAFPRARSALAGAHSQFRTAQSLRGVARPATCVTSRTMVNGTFDRQGEIADFTLPTGCPLCGGEL